MKYYKATFEVFKKAISHLLEEEEILILEWEWKQDKSCWRATYKPKNNSITTTMIEYLYKYNCGIHINNDDTIIIYH